MPLPPNIYLASSVRRISAFLCCFLTPLILSAATHTWTGAVNSLWSVNANWTGGTPAGDPDADLIFPDVVNKTSNDDLAGSLTVRSLTFQAVGYTVGAQAGSSIALSQRISWETSAGINTISLPIQILTTVSIDMNLFTPAGELRLSGPISGGQLSIGSNQHGTVVLSGTNTYNSTISSGSNQRILVNGAQPQSSALVYGGFFGGVGTIGGLIVPGGVLWPGTDVPGILNVQGNAFFSENNSVLKVRITGPVPGSAYDRLSVDGSVTLERPIGGTLSGVHLQVLAPYVASIGESFTILQATGTVTGTFNGIPDGTVLPFDCQNFRVNYTANSIVLTRVAGGGPPLSDVSIIASGSQNVCTNSLGGTVIVTDSGGCTASHQWGFRAVSGGAVTAIPGETGSSYTIDGSDFPGVGTYYLVETTTPQFGSPMTSNELTINVATPPTAVASGSNTICAGSSAMLSGSGAAMCSWTPSTGLNDPNSCSPVATPSGTTTYSLTVSGASGCTSVNSAQVTVTVDASCQGVGPQSFYTLTPCRLVDTRGSAGPNGGPALSAGSERVFALVGECGIPAGAKAVFLTLTVTQPTLPGFLTHYPTGTPLPTASSINFSAGQTRSGNGALQLSGDGHVSVFFGGPTQQATGTVHLILDVTGYFR